MNRAQHEATREREAAEAKFLRAYGWTQIGRLWTHPRAPEIRKAYSHRDALMMTDANSLRFGWAS
jgi:hypothetical protein